MFEEITRKLDSVFRKLRGQGRLTEEDVKDALRDIRRVLLEADVHFRVAKQFIQAVQEKAVGQEVLKSVTPGQQVVKIVYDELTRLMGQTAADLHFSSIPPTIIMVVGLQGSGKTTFAGKLARRLKKQGKAPMLVAADIYRPAAVEQLKTIGEQIGVPVFFESNTPPVELARSAVQFARQHGYDVCILDTAGRLHIDPEMMNELVQIREAVRPHEILFVADGMTGQDAVRAAEEFLRQLDFDGVVLTKMDGDARGGAALSIKAVTGKPIKFIGIGEKLDALERFHPDRMASRILGMGDIVTLVEKAQEAVEKEKAQELERKLRRFEFTLEDFLEQMRQVRKMGPLEELIQMIPGLSRLPAAQLQVDEKELVKAEAIINSMTREERRKPQILNASRKRRIARGSGTTVQDVNRLLHQFAQLQKMMKRMKKLSRKGFGRGMFPF